MRDSPCLEPAPEEEQEMKVEDYGLIGELQTAALVVWTDRIDWLCLPRRRAESSAASATRESGAVEPDLKAETR
jgi:hypothetical protein